MNLLLLVGGFCFYANDIIDVGPSLTSTISNLNNIFFEES